MNNIMIKVDLEFNEEFFINVLETALYDGIHYWVEEIKWSRKADDNKSRAEQIIQDGCIMTLIVDTGNDYEEFNLTKNKLIRGFKRYCSWKVENEMYIYTNASHIDSEEADLIVQFALFDEIMFA